MPKPQELPGPDADVWDWQMKGLCRGVDSSMFFHPDGERGRARAQREKRAKEMCRSCPVIAQCREHALAVGEPYGIWGGLSEAERGNPIAVAEHRGRGGNKLGSEPAEDAVDKVVADAEARAGRDRAAEIAS